MSGKLGSADLVAATNTEIYVCPSGEISTVNVNICNRSSASSNIRIAVTDSGIASITNADYIEYDLEIYPSGMLERTGIVLSSGQSIVAYSSGSSVSIQVWGWEETA